MTDTTFETTIHDGGSGARLRWLVSDSIVIAKRSAAHIRQIPEKLIDVTVQPLMFVLLFAFVFGGVIKIPGGGDYKDYLMGGILVQTLVFGMMGPGVSIGTDLQEGILDRFRSLPMARRAYLFGHLTAELLATLIAIVVMVIAGLLIGWGIHTDFLHALGAFGLMLLLAVTSIWVGTTIGIIARSPDAVQGIAFLVIFPMTFIASTFVPVGGLPDGLQQVAEWNPVSCLAAALRTLFGNPTATPADAAWPLQHPVLSSVIWCVAILAVMLPVGFRAFNKRTAG